ncbi:hypothetical protein [Streptomyces sp. NPDC001165]|uniref:DUF7848 domain-containing protein n=1 Tax=Streptomyces sp. NPDC001165 TaxID=3364546 RepID=UPI0036A31575
MSPHVILRHESWMLEPDREPDAEPTTYAMQCAVDGETLPISDDFLEPHIWVLERCGQHPSHHTYREIVTRPWHTWRHA